jgi:bifunctional DNA-binding transcriptional regulator/antitoxin component of YhaV-PrlF toxin-antitoxin module
MGRKPREIKLRKIYRDGKIYIPSSIRKHFRGCLFDVRIENGKIILDPVKEW